MNSTVDVIHQFNYVGYQEVCIYPTASELAYVEAENKTTTKGVGYVYPGYANKNSTGIRVVP